MRSKDRIDPFFPEEDEMIEYFEKYMEENGYANR